MPGPACRDRGNPFGFGEKLGVGEGGGEMTQPAKVQEPSMEEILASIRRIIADDEAKPAGDKPPGDKHAGDKPAGEKAPAPAAAAPAPKPPMRDIPPRAPPAAQATKAAAPAQP